MQATWLHILQFFEEIYYKGTFIYSNINKPCVLLHSNKSFILCHIFVGLVVPHYIINIFIFKSRLMIANTFFFLCFDSMKDSYSFSFLVPILLVSSSIMFINSFLWNKLETLNFHILHFNYPFSLESFDILLCMWAISFLYVFVSKGFFLYLFLTILR